MLSFQPCAKNDTCMLDAPQTTEQQQGTPNTNMSTAPGITVIDLRDYNCFSKLFVEKRKLRAGSDGAVYEYKHIASKIFIDVEKPHSTKSTPSDQLANEITVVVCWSQVSTPISLA
jgi:hypothetical protein